VRYHYFSHRAARTYLTRRVLCYTFIILRHTKGSCQLCLWKSLTLDHCAHSAHGKFQYFIQPARCDIFIDFHWSEYFINHRRYEQQNNMAIGFTLYMPFFLGCERERCWERQSCEETVSWVVMKCRVRVVPREISMMRYAQTAREDRGEQEIWMINARVVWAYMTK
jgi:hypothetical protein